MSPRALWLSIFGLLCSAHAQQLSLRDALALAEKSRPSVAAAQARVREAKANKSALGAYGALRLEAGEGTQPTVGGGEDLLMAQPIDLFGKLSASRASGAAGVASAVAALRQTRLDLQAEVVGAYAELVSAQSLERTGNELLDIEQKSYDATKIRADAGDIPPVELLRADLDLKRAKQTVANRELALTAARKRFEGAVGASLPAGESVSEATLDLGPLPSSARPDIQQLEAGVASARAESNLTRLSRLPDVELQFRRAPWGEPEQYNGRAQIVWNLWDWGASTSKQRAARSAIAAAQRDLEDKRAKAATEIEAARLDLAAAQSALDSNESLRADALALLEKEQRGFQLGGNTLIDVLEATRALREIEDAEADAKLHLLRAQAAFMTASGIVLAEAK